MVANRLRARRGVPVDNRLAPAALEGEHDLGADEG
jgi:hypothetical protein